MKNTTTKLKKRIAIIEGDGIGPEVVQASITVLDAIAKVYRHEFEYHYCLMGAVAIDKTGIPLPEETIAVCLNSDAVLFGAIGHPKYDNDPTAKVRPEQGLLQLRKSLQLFANVRPICTYPQLNHLSPIKNDKIKDVDFIIYRELTGGIYFGNKSLSSDGQIASDDCTYTAKEIERIARLAFAHAQLRNNKLTLVDKANVLETSRLWRNVVQQLSTQYSDVKVEYLFVDNAAMQIIINPKQFDIILTENMFGDILSDEASVITGSIGMLPSASLGNKVALFEPIHGSYPQAAGKNIANPMGSILSAAMMLDHFSLNKEADSIRKAVSQALYEGQVSIDINAEKNVTTSAIASYIAKTVLAQ